MTDASAWNLNWADFVIIGIILLSSLVSIARGFVKEAISLTTWIVAIWVAMHFYLPLSELFIKYIDTPSARLVAAFIVLFIVTVMIGAAFNFLLNGLINRAGLGGFNRLVGVLFGFARGVLIVGVIVLMARHTGVMNDPWWQQSSLVPHFMPIADTISDLMPEKVHQVTRIFSDEKKLLS